MSPSRGIVADDATGQIARVPRPCTIGADDPAEILHPTRRIAGRIFDREDPFDSASEVFGFDGTAVRIPDAFAELERVGSATLRGLRDGQRQVRDERPPVQPTDALEAHQAVVAERQDAPRQAAVCDGRVDRVEAVVVPPPSKFRLGARPPARERPPTRLRFERDAAGVGSDRDRRYGA